MNTNLYQAFIFLTLLACTPGSQAQNIPSKESQIKTAVLAAPEESREGAKVYGYDAKGNFVTLREGSNEMICIADDPNNEGFSVSCYHQDLDVFMERGRELKKEGKSFQEIFDLREEEVKSGKLKMPKDGATLYVLTADEENYRPESGEVDKTYLRYVVYIPWATQESTGLPLSAEAPGMPWIMDPGTHRAHIMINPPKEE
ncbi:hypothetical protein [Pleomorphovibrio marinus]|uniref:hypothetical protein n=1 Tax=Pleomorphovibrio marinus TaxID=2164132 RepID=UPI000E0AAF03|nr:hypothetical protein [Pleomorphovibrio marinus]